MLVSEHALSLRQACRTARLARSAHYATPRPRDDGPVIAAIEGYVHDNPRHGFDKLYPAVRGQGFGKCRLYRVYKALRLNIKRGGKHLDEVQRAPVSASGSRVHGSRKICAGSRGRTSVASPLFARSP